MNIPAPVTAAGTCPISRHAVAAATASHQASRRTPQPRRGIDVGAVITRALTAAGSDEIGALALRGRYISPVMNGLVIRSWPMLEPAPWPQMKPTSSPSGSSFVLDRIDQRGVIAAGQIGAPDRAVEQDVADMGEAQFLVEEHHAARRMAGAMQDVEGQIADRDLIAFVEPAVGPEIAHAGHAEARAARDDIVEQELVGDMRALDLAPSARRAVRRRRRHGRYGHGSARSSRP